MPFIPLLSIKRLWWDLIIWLFQQGLQVEEGIDQSFPLAMFILFLRSGSLRLSQPVTFIHSLSWGSLRTNPWIKDQCYDTILWYSLCYTSITDLSSWVIHGWWSAVLTKTNPIGLGVATVTISGLLGQHLLSPVQLRKSLSSQQFLYSMNISKMCMLRELLKRCRIFCQALLPQAGYICIDHWGFNRITIKSHLPSLSFSQFEVLQNG